MKTLGRRALTLGFAALSAPAVAQPARPITLVVAYPPGGDTDALARLFADRLAPRLGRQVIVENRSGASGVVGTQYVARVPPDGSILLFAPSTFPLAPLVLKQGVTYNPVSDFTPVHMIATNPMVLVASRQSGIRSLADVVSQARAGHLVGYGSPGSGSPMHIFAEMFNHLAKLQLAEISYRGVAPVVNDLLSNSIGIGLVTIGAVYDHFKAGTLVPVAVSEGARSPVLPEVPTYKESGYDLDVTTWWGLFGPRGLPTSMVETLNSHMNDVLALPDVQERLAAFGGVPAGGPPSRLADVNRTDFERFARVVRDLNIRVE
ncbi:Bug family tripartite tricarboxylate transporter substrate binding protein [Roseomonas populi]|uniref:Tripartite tricarboxylate transporter substrate-binding protein n=1 Tax=Roseomonas populi TaxID=3121582 RepID=A0ABT1X3L5_9PROT|nr:tripartite tricarboxylate transporter substrate-binding protein [Roseomonas pecuniae]MCR0982702.1 tripartite tricarboxylate transporter substrate-binding protein [Roseomonas pecuniae]